MRKKSRDGSSRRGIYTLSEAVPQASSVGCTMSISAMLPAPLCAGGQYRGIDRVG